MKNIKVIGIISIAVILLVAILMAGRMGQTSKALVKGKILLSPDLMEDAERIHTLFITVFDQDRPMPPYGAFKKQLSEITDLEIYEFVLTNENLMRMVPDLPPPKSLRVKARLDVDGQGGADQPGDLVGEVSGIMLGQDGVVIEVNHRVE